MAPRKKVSKEDKLRLIKRFEEDGDYIGLAANLEVNEKTARTIVRRHRLELHQSSLGGHKKTLLDGETGETLIEFLEENSLATLDVMRVFLESVCGLSVTTGCISKWLDGKLITLKKTREVIAERNSQRVKDLRCEYARNGW